VSSNFSDQDLDAAVKLAASNLRREHDHCAAMSAKPEVNGL